MSESQPKLPQAPATNSIEADLSAWKRAVDSGNQAEVRALAARFLSVEGARWQALAGHVAWYYLRMGEAGQAADIYEELIRRDPANVEPRHFAFMARLLEGREEAALSHLRVALERRDRLPEALRNSVGGFAGLLLDFELHQGRRRQAGRIARAFSKIAAATFPRSRSALGEAALLLWQWRPGAAPKDFRIDPGRVKPHPEAADAVKRVRTALARVIIRKEGFAEDLWVGSVKPPESVWLYTAVRERRPAVVVQSGVFAGYSACLLAEACRQNGRGVVHCIDPNIPHRHVLDPREWASELAQELGLSQHLRFYAGTFATPLWSRESWMGETLPPVVGYEVFATVGRADLVFVDSDHSTPSALADLTLAACNLAEGGVILLHDTRSWRQVRRAVAALLMENRVDSYLPYGRRTLKFCELCPHGSDGLGMITVGPR